MAHRPLSESLRSLFACEVAVAHAVPREVDDELYPDERAHIAKAVAKRRAEFGTARLIARRALAELGFRPCSLVPRADRSPRWPEGSLGSISHCDGLCAVVVTRSSSACGVGLDVERADRFTPDLEHIVCTETERRWLDDVSAELRQTVAALTFSAKEAFYKCQFPTTGEFLDHRDVDIRIDLDEETFAVTCVHRSGAVWRALENVKGRLLRTSDLVVTAATWNGGGKPARSQRLS